jgi:Icc-related predicted phosphoesterase
MLLKATFISDTHGRHQGITDKLTGGDIIFHTGDHSSTGSELEIENFLNWYSQLPYTYKVFIAGNHDLGFEHQPDIIQKLISKYDVTYLQDTSVEIEGLKIYGSPWQPRFFDWAFNVDRGSDELDQIWAKIPEDIDILLTHGPAWGYLDRVTGREDHLGCELLKQHIHTRVKPLVHACGHIHTGRGYLFNETTHFINSSILDEKYRITFNPIDVTINTESSTRKNFLITIQG